MNRATLALVIIVAGAASAGAQGPPIHTDTPIMLGLQGRGARVFLRSIQRDELLTNGAVVSDPLGQKLSMYVYPVIIPHNLRTSLQVGAVVPFLTKRVETVMNKQTRSGMGDVNLFVKQLVVQVDRKQETFRVAVKGITKLPTGSDEAPVPLGTGSLDFGASAVAAWVRGRWGLYGELMYFVNTSNDKDGNAIDYGNRFGYNTALGFRALPVVYEHYPSPQLNIYLELNGNTVARSRVRGLDDLDSGGTQLFVSPGIQFIGGRTWLIEASVQLPLVDKPNGTQLDTRWTATAGARMLIF